MKHFLRHLFIPHESNNHRAKILHHSSILVLITILFTGSVIFPYVYRHDRAVLGISYSVNVDELLVMTNQKRVENGLSPLSINTSLTQAAQRKAEDMFVKNYWAHIAPDGTTPWYFIKSSGYEYVYAGENLARGYTSTSDVINAWMASPSHRENMLSPNYTEIGFAIKDGTLTGDDTVLVVEELGSRTSSNPPAQDQPLITSTPTPIQVAQVVLTTPTPTIMITPTPTAPSTVTVTPVQASQVAAFHSDPLISKPTAQKNIAVLVVGAILTLFALDMIIVRRKKIVRILSHNLDHIIFFGMLLLVLLLLTKGGIL